MQANNEISQLKEQCSVYKEEISQLKSGFDSMNEEYENLSYRCKTVSFNTFYMFRGYQIWVTLTLHNYAYINQEVGLEICN